MNPIITLLDAELHIAGSEILWREVIGNGFGLASAIGGMRRRVWAWPIGPGEENVRRPISVAAPE